MTQYARVLSVLRDESEPQSLFQIRNRIKKVHNRVDSECAISARIRDIRRELMRDGFTVESRRAGPGKSYHIYWISTLRK